MTIGSRVRQREDSTKDREQGREMRFSLVEKDKAKWGEFTKTAPASFFFFTDHPQSSAAF